MRLPGLIYVAVQPAARLIDRLRFSQKLISLGLIFVIAVLFLCVQLMPLLNEHIQFIDKEQRGLQVAEPLHRAIGAVQVIRAGWQPGTGISPADKAGFDAAWAGLRAWQHGAGADMPQSEGFDRIEAHWNALPDTLQQSDVPAAHKALEELVTELTTLGESVADASNLTLDPEINAYVLMDALFFKYPAVIEQLSQLQVLLTGLQGTDRSVTVSEAGAAFGMLRVAEVMLDRAQPGIDRVRAALPESAQALQVPLAEARRLSDQLCAEVRAMVDSATTINAAALADLSTRTIAAQGDLYRALIPVLEQALATRRQGYESHMSAGVWTVVAFAFAALYFFFGFVRSLSATLRGLSRAATDLAAGKFPERIDLQSRDELQEIANEIHRVTQVLRAFEDEQHTMFVKHQTGMVSHRIDESRFAGAYRTIATGVNDLAASHIAVKNRIVAIAADYARGNFSEHMDRLPGEEERISLAMDAVRDSLSKIRDAILQLGDAAARGELSLRGDEAAFEFDFRDMVSGLNRLMAVTEDGVQSVSQVMQAVAEGDLRQRMQGDYKGAFAALQIAANQSIEQLSKMVRQINDSAQRIYTASGEIVSGNDDLAQRTEQQAASLEQTASSMEELTATVRQNAENARLADQHSQGAAELAERGADVVSGVVQTMHEIEASSRRIVDIIGVIDGIAFQTNILALNAAVEAARAGDQGRGFAVVASEVRSLAQRSAQAAKEIKGLIDDSVNKVQSGSALVDTAGSTISDVRTSVRQAATLIGEIASASGEQRAGIEQVNATVTQMDQVTQQNAALVEEATAAARSLEEQADQLARMVAAFKL